MVSKHEARPNSWPWQVELLFQNKHACSGALVEQHWILTSAACVNTTDKPGDWAARVGEHDRIVLEGYEETIKIEKIVISPEGRIALLKTERMAVLHQRVTTVCLPHEDTEFPVGSSCYVSGWKSTERRGNTSNVLNEAKVELVSRELCNASYIRMISRYERCASFPRGEDKVCSVENGGPLVCARGDGKFVLVGVTSSEDWCSNLGQYGVFLDVKEVLSFIHSNIAVKKVTSSV